MKRTGKLVPLLEDLMTRPVRIESTSDVEFVRNLLVKQRQREELRSLKGHYSPSALANCLRQVYLGKHAGDLGIKRKVPVRVEPNFYFLTGEWLHLKWQYALFKLNKALPDEKFALWGTEVPVTSKHKDHGGTIDAICAINEEYTAVDFKGVNVRAFSQAEAGDYPLNWGIQLADYLMLANVDKTLKIPRLEKGLLVFENKGGPKPGTPIALLEIEVKLEQYLPEIKHRLGKLRQSEEENKIPRPECTSTKSIQFQDCPFRAYCKNEVGKIESRNAEGRKVEISTRSRTNRARRNKSKR